MKRFIFALGIASYRGGRRGYICCLEDLAVELARMFWLWRRPG